MSLVTVSLLCRSSLVWCSPICSFFLLAAEPFWVLFRKSFLIPTCSYCFFEAVYFLLLLGVVSGFQALYQGLWYTLSWFWYKVKDRALVSVFYMWKSSFLSSICWKGCLFSITCFGSLCQRSVGYRWVGLCLDLLFWFIGLLSSLFCHVG
jgi:hypothetical protein